MTRRILNRRELRAQADGLAQDQARASDPTPVPAAPATTSKVKAPAGSKVKKPRAKKAPPRVCARWGIFDGGMNQVAIFDYSERAAADAKLADLLIQRKGIHFLQIVKEAMPAPVPV
jgi:hypothetical protein